MKLDVLVATVRNDDITSLIKKMNIQTNAIVCNQSDTWTYSELNYGDNKIQSYTFNEKGVGMNRNNALMRSHADYCVISDDDMVFRDGYEKILEELIRNNLDADVLIFNLLEKKGKRFITKKKFNVNRLNYMRFGAARLVVKQSSIRKNGIFFNLEFGGGTRFSAGEDTLFLKECLDKKLKIVAVPEYLAELTNDRESTWFTGYNEKYFKDKGALYTAISNNKARILCLQFLIRHKNLYKNDISFSEALKSMKKGISEYRDWRF